MKKITIITVFALFIYACSHKTASKVTESTDTLTMEAKGALYAANCVKCHKLVEPEKFTKEEWIGWMDKMAPKAKITDIQKADIYDYLAAHAKAN